MRRKKNFIFLRVTKLSISEKHRKGVPKKVTCQSNVKQNQGRNNKKKNKLLSYQFYTAVRSHMTCPHHILTTRHDDSS